MLLAEALIVVMVLDATALVRKSASNVREVARNIHLSAPLGQVLLHIFPSVLLAAELTGNFLIFAELVVLGRKFESDTSDATFACTICT